jgi:hypothetical protein
LQGGVVKGGELAGAVGLIMEQAHGFDDDHYDVHPLDAQLRVGPERVGGATR